MVAMFAMVFSGCATTHSASQTGGLPGVTAAEEQSPTPKTLYAMAKILLSQDKNDQAELVLLKLAEEFPGYTPVYCELASLRLKQGRTEEAIEELSRGLEVAPNDPVLLNNAGVCLLLKGEYHDALGRLTAAAEVVPHSAAYQANKALALGMLGLYGDSLTAYEQVLKTKDAQHNLDVIRDMWQEDIEE
jgi:tetratricopeptide (TPR) repeat protein